MGGKIESIQFNNGEPSVITYRKETEAEEKERQQNTKAYYKWAIIGSIVIGIFTWLMICASDFRPTTIKDAVAMLVVSIVFYIILALMAAPRNESRPRPPMGLR